MTFSFQLGRMYSCKLKTRIILPKTEGLVVFQASWQTFLIVCRKFYKRCCETWKDGQRFNQRKYAVHTSH